MTVSLIPTEYSSRFDSTKSITSENWAVTIIKVEGAMKSHAQLCIEVVRRKKEVEGKEECVTIMAHLTGRNGFCSFNKFGVVKLKIFSIEERIIYGFKSETSMITCDQGRALIEDVENDIENNQNNPIPFYVMGCNSIFARTVKCYETSSKELLQIKKTDPSIFLKLCKKFEAEGFEADRTFKDMSREELILGLMKEHLKIVLREPHSCITWARSKLSIIGLQPPRKVLDSIITVTALHTKSPTANFLDCMFPLRPSLS